VSKKDHPVLQTAEPTSFKIFFISKLVIIL
jgi:hypothetical protein